ncbi:insulin-like 5a isoform X2 [Heptranchias perlo]|uniref:insulin-like 5a isoform X2 n=1 Tax=Heptranchias perlo TaxID=212740 RepID=UPI00355A0C3E
MRSVTLSALLPLMAVLAVSRVRADRPHVVKLCGREFLRAVIYTCGGSRWRREPGTGAGAVGLWEDQKSPFMDNSDFSSFQNWFPDFHQRLASSSEDTLSYKPELLEEILEAFENPSRDKRELSLHLNAVCCQRGCNKKQLSSLC